MASTHYCPTDRVHFTWDTGNEPLLTVADGDTVVFETRDVSDNQIGPGSDTSVIAGLDWDRVYPLAGPVYVEGAEPGDTLAVEILDLHTKGWGWTAILPGLGLLADDFTEPYLRIFDLTPRRRHALPRGHRDPADAVHGHDGRLPGGRERAAGDAARHVRRQPGHAPARRRARRCSCRSRSRARCSRTGDAHGCQGDGEICVTGLEAPMYADDALHASRRAARSRRRSTAPRPAR